ncbi:hypothetical protein BFJ63_vAg17129 [Fusarium oxysporum f. sp. narcissi]|uniref:Uncharacterized protein n=1 Tax=Fusarium oxysporum f. sp. narcissi TaxID=451672 RepID=A0A4Q2V5Q5_FUSOX|nr:hypothetical protein BFJ63_vAg17129 [Fusarium oxysporum f. sp. narcissi]
MEDQLESDSTIPRAVRKVGEAAEDDTSEDLIRGLQKMTDATPNLTSSNETIPVETLVQFIRRNQQQRTRSPSELQDEI